MDQPHPSIPKMNYVDFTIGRFGFYAWFDWIDQAVEVEIIPTASMNISAGELHLVIAWLTFGFDIAWEL